MVNPDYGDFFFALNARDARFLVVGAYAVTIHAKPRFTKDLAVWIDPDPRNAQAVFEALAQFGAPLEEIAPKDLARPGVVLQIGVAPNRIDVMTSVTGLEFGAAYGRRVASRYGDCAISILSREDLIANKRAVGRPQDLVDADDLERRKP